MKGSACHSAEVNRWIKKGDKLEVASINRCRVGITVSMKIHKKISSITPEEKGQLANQDSSGNGHYTGVHVLRFQSTLLH